MSVYKRPRLDLSKEKLKKILQITSGKIGSYYEEIRDCKVKSWNSEEEVIQAIQEPLPNSSTEIQQLIERIFDQFVDLATHNAGPYYYGYITGGGNQAALPAELISAALNQNNLKWHSSPISSELEHLVIRWCAEFIGYDPNCGGTLASGGSEANFLSLAVAVRNKAHPQVAENGLYNSTPLTVYVSSEGHSSFDKAITLLGLGKKHLRKIPIDDKFRVKTKIMRSQIEDDLQNGFQPICAIGIAGTTNTGAVDDLMAIADICEEFDLWYHVDAAYGGPAAALETKKGMFAGLERADSVIMNPHKWLYVPFGVSCVLVEDKEKLRQTFSLIPHYLKSPDSGNKREETMEYSLQLTKSFKSLKVWMTFKAYGTEKIKESIEYDIKNAGYLGGLISGDPDFEIMAPIPLSIVCFRYNPASQNLTEESLNKLNKSLIRKLEKEGIIFLAGTRLNKSNVLRACFINHRTNREDVEFLFKTVKNTASETE